MPDVYDFRRRNLSRLAADGDHGGQRRLADRLGKDESQISQLLGKKQMGADLAREIERTLKLPYGWMDTEHHFSTPAAIDVAHKFEALDPDDQQRVLDYIARLSK